MNKRALKVLAIVAGAAGIFCGWKAYAGQRNLGETVLIYGSGLRVHGALGGVRNSQSQTEYIGCKVTASTGGSSVSCTAQDAAGAQFNCSSSNQFLIDAALGISGDSWVQMIKDSTGTCTSITVENASTHEPKAP